MFQTEHPIVLALFPGLPCTHHLTSLLPCLLQTLIISHLCYHGSLPAGFSPCLWCLPMELSRSTSRNFLNHNCNPGPRCLQKLWWLTLLRRCYPFFLPGRLMGSVGCTSTLHTTPSFSGIALTGSHECHYSARKVRTEARTQMLISAFLVYFTAFILQDSSKNTLHHFSQPERMALGISWVHYISHGSLGCPSFLTHTSSGYCC